MKKVTNLDPVKSIRCLLRKIKEAELHSTSHGKFIAYEFIIESFRPVISAFRTLQCSSVQSWEVPVT